MSEHNNLTQELEGLNSTLKSIVGLLAFSVINSSELKNTTKKEKILLLHQIGINDHDVIARLVDTTSGNVQKEISLAKK